MRARSLLEKASETVTGLAGERDVDAVARIEDVRLRNYDSEVAYEIGVRFEEDGEVVFAETYDLPPGATVSEVGAVDAGRYDVAVEMDGKVAELPGCRVDEWPEHTVLVEVGNGVVAASTDGYHSDHRNCS